MNVRNSFPDALRAFAQLGVLLINAAGYLSGPLGPVRGEHAAGSGGATREHRGLAFCP